MAAQKMDQSAVHLKDTRDRLHAGIAAKIAQTRLNGHPEARLPNTLSLSFRNLEANRILEEIGLEVAVSAGAACHSDTVMLSHVLKAMRVPLEWAKGTVRFSTGRMTSSDDIDRAVEVVVNAVQNL
jgi:cysteine desulfurase